MSNQGVKNKEHRPKSSIIMGRNDPTREHFPPDFSRKTPNLVKKKETKGHSRRTKDKSTINGILRKRILPRF